MEFEHVGLHCEVAECRMKDFLPFICDVCKGSYCSEHRMYESHGCVATQSKDITSIDCPVCKKSIKYSKADNVDVVWELHFKSSCSQIPPSTHEATKKCCARLNCRTVIGPSNSLTCTKCNKLVCLPHRLPEDHPCLQAIPPSALASKRAEAYESKKANGTNNSINSTSNSTTSKNITFGTNKLNVKSNSNSKTKVSQDTIYSTSNRRKYNNESSTTINNSSNSYGNNSSYGNNNRSDNNNIANQEQYVCPICSHRVFTDAVLLISHMQTDHPEPLPNSNPSSQKQNVPDVDSPVLSSSDIGLEVCYNSNYLYYV